MIARLLALESGARVLDVPCGEGRIAGRLAALGAHVTGLDTSDRFLTIARERHPNVTFEHRDMRELGYRGEFDAIVNFFTSFGYFDPATNDRVLASFAAALRPGGRLLLDMANPDKLKQLLELTGGTAAVFTERDGNHMVDEVSYDAGERRSVTKRHIVRDGNVRSLVFTVEQVPAPELTERLRAAGFSTVELFGQDGTPFDPDGRRLIAVATR
jgi:SAM-dependent methyltransferase